MDLVRALVVDDSPVNQRLMVLVLESVGYAVDAVDDGAAAIEAVATRTYDIVLMDCEMPVLDGYDAAAEIRRREPEGVHLPIVAVTGSAKKSDVERALAAGMDVHVPKPIDRELLCAVVAGLLRRLSADGAETIDMERERGDFDRAKLEDLRGIDGTGAALRALLSLFISDAATRLDALRRAATAGDLETVLVHTHTLKGSAGTFGAVALGALLGRVEEAALLGQPPAPQELADLRSLVAAAVAHVEAHAGPPQVLVEAPQVTTQGR